MSRLTVVLSVLMRPHSAMEESDMKNRPYSWIYTAVLVLVGISIALTGGVAAQSTGYVDIAASDLAGGGTAADPYEITNASELQAMEDDLDANYELVSDIDASQTARFDDGAGFEPVGDPKFNESTPPPFTGTFDGNNNTITGLTIDRPDETEIGLFGATGSSATLRNVALVNVTVTGGDNVGGLVGRNNRGNIMTARATGSVNGTEGDVGGLVGGNFGTITNASASGSVAGTNPVGGLVGLNGGEIQKATASGNVTGSQFVGGLVGDNFDGSVQIATASGSVTGEIDVGGLVGVNKALIQNAAVSGSVTGESNVGGLVGTNSGFRGEGTVRNTFAVGSVSGDNSVGGLVGDNRNNGTVEQSYFNTEATGQTTSAGSATGLTTTQMQGQAAAENMDGFDFDNTWTTTSEYPALRALSEVDENVDNDSPGSPQVQLSNITLTPQSVDSDAESTHRLSFEAQNISADENEDEFDITFPDNVELVNYSNVAIDEKSSGVEMTGNTLEFSVNPTGGGSTQISGELNVTVSATN